MQFKHPEILYFLFLLVIPILVHLFQFRRFKKEYFTNVKLLKEIQIQTRKIKSIKKWLLLATRLLLLAAFIIAFAQPFFTAKDAKSKQNELVIVLDNSFSMQAKGEKGELLKGSVQELLENIPENQKLSIVTNSTTFWDTDIKSIQQELQKLDYSSIPFQLDALINQVENKKRNTLKDYILISDGIASSSEGIAPSDNELFWLQTKGQNTSNVSIENVTLSELNNAFYELEINLKLFGEIDNEIALTLFDNDKTLAKTQVSFKNNTEKIKLSIPKKEMIGKVVIQDNSLAFDNEFFFTIKKPEKTKVTLIGSIEKNKFLHRIYTEDVFEIYDTTVESLNFSRLENQQTILLNEVSEVSSALQSNLISFYENGGNLILIPSNETPLDNLNVFSKKLGNVSFSNTLSIEKQISKIVFNHPVFANVFEKKVTNFQYPKVQSSRVISKNVSPILQYDDGEIFAGSITNKIGKAYFFTSAINKLNSNFQNSPLIVPALYNMAIDNTSNGKLSFTIGENENLIIDKKLNKEEVISIANNYYNFIPLQQIISDKVKLSFSDYPEKAGNFSILQKGETIDFVSFNYPRKESDVTLQSTLNNDNFTKINTIEEVLNELHAKRTDSVLWKWFIIATLLLLITELLIQKFVK